MDSGVMAIGAGSCSNHADCGYGSTLANAVGLITTAKKHKDIAFTLPPFTVDSRLSHTCSRRIVGSDSRSPLPHVKLPSMNRTVPSETARLMGDVA